MISTFGEVFSHHSMAGVQTVGGRAHPAKRHHSLAHGLVSAFGCFGIDSQVDGTARFAAQIS